MEEETYEEAEEKEEEDEVQVQVILRGPSPVSGHYSLPIIIIVVI